MYSIQIVGKRFGGSGNPLDSRGRLRVPLQGTSGVCIRSRLSREFTQGPAPRKDQHLMNLSQLLCVGPKKPTKPGAHFTLPGLGWPFSTTKIMYI